MRSSAAEVESLNRGAVSGVAERGAREEQLVQRQRTVHDVALRRTTHTGRSDSQQPAGRRADGVDNTKDTYPLQAEDAFEVERRQNVAVQHRLGEAYEGRKGERHGHGQNQSNEATREGGDTKVGTREKQQ